MTPSQFLSVAIDPALSLLPGSMTSDEARIMILAICLQESDLENRRQISGPARGFAQFEKAGLIGVLAHSRTWTHVSTLISDLEYDNVTATELHAAMEHNDILTCAMARLLLWTLPTPLPAIGDLDTAWAQYLSAWRPGKPRPEKWTSSYSRAWATVGVSFIGTDFAITA